MKRKAYQIVFSATLVLVMVVFISAIFFVNPSSSFAASGKKKSHAVARTSAVEYTEAQIKKLQSTLNITEAQKPLWNNLTQVMRENAKEMDVMNKGITENTEPMNAVEHMKFHSQITQSHLAQINKLIPSFEAFYNSLSDQQKNITDMVFRTGEYGKAKRK